MPGDCVKHQELVQKKRWKGFVYFVCLKCFFWESADLSDDLPSSEILKSRQGVVLDNLL